MAIVSLTSARIRECVLKLVEKAKVKIPEFPIETSSTEYYYVSELFEEKGEQMVFAFKCEPALKGEEGKYMMLSCAICLPDKGVELEIPMMYEPANKIVERIDSEENINECSKTFVKLLHDAKNLDFDDD